MKRTIFVVISTVLLLLSFVVPSVKAMPTVTNNCGNPCDSNMTWVLGSFNVNGADVQPQLSTYNRSGSSLAGRYLEIVHNTAQGPWYIKVGIMWDDACGMGLEYFWADRNPTNGYHAHCFGPFINDHIGDVIEFAAELDGLNPGDYFITLRDVTSGNIYCDGTTGGICESTQNNSVGAYDNVLIDENANHWSVTTADTTLQATGTWKLLNYRNSFDQDITLTTGASIVGANPPWAGYVSGSSSTKEYTCTITALSGGGNPC